MIIESWRAQYPARLYPGQQTVDVPEGEPYPRTRRCLAWYRPDGWLAEGRRLRPADLVVFAYLTPLQAPPYLAIMAAWALHRRPRSSATTSSRTSAAPATSRSPAPCSAARTR